MHVVKSVAPQQNKTKWEAFHVSAASVYNGVLRYDWKYHCHAGGGWGNGSGLSVEDGSPSVSASRCCHLHPKPWHQTEGGTGEDMRKTSRGRRRRGRKKEPLRADTVQVQWNAKVPFDLRCQTTQNALCLQFQWSWACRRGALGLATLAVTLLSPRKCLLPLNAEGKLEGRHPDRQTDKPQAAQRSGVEIAVTSHRKSLLTGMLHCSDTTKWAFTDPNTQGEKCGVNRRPGAGWELN